MEYQGYKLTFIAGAWRITEQGSGPRVLFEGSLTRCKAWIDLGILGSY